MYQSKTGRPWFQVLNGYSCLHVDTRIKSKVFWRVQEILILMGTKIFQIGQREAEKMKFKNFNLRSKKDSFYWLFVFSKVGKHLWTFVFFCILGQKSGVFVIIGKEISKIL